MKIGKRPARILLYEQVVEDLEEKGVSVIDTIEELENLQSGSVVIRSHGVPKKIYDAIEKQNLEIVDATCPFVKKIHNIVKKESEKGKRIVIIGNDNHPEVEGIKGWVVGEAIVIKDEEDIEKIEQFQAVGNLFGLCTGRALFDVFFDAKDIIDFDFYILYLFFLFQKTIYFFHL